jgi:hypothetical protein
VKADRASSIRTALLTALRCTFVPWAIAACAGAPEPRETAPAPPPPPGGPVSILELVPPEASGAALVEVTRLRASSHGPALTNMVRRLGVYRWEDALGVDLRTQVERLIVFGVTTPEQGPGDLAQVLDTVRGANVGAVVELRPDAVEGDGACYARDLQGLEGTPIEQPAAGYRAYRCGRFVVARRDDLAGPLGPHRDVQLAQALAQVDRAAQEATIFVALAGPAMIDRVSCGDTTVQLAGWQHVTVELVDGMALHGRYHAASADDSASLQRCVSDGMGGFAQVPLFSQLQLGDVLRNAAIEPDPAVAGDVVLDASFSERELDLMLGLLELVGTELEH